MQQLVDQSRIDLNAPDLRWFISEQHPKFHWPNVERVNAQLMTLGKSDTRIIVIKTEHLPCGPFHFGTEGTLQLGQEMAAVFLAQP